MANLIGHLRTNFLEIKKIKVFMTIVYGLVAGLLYALLDILGSKKL